MKDLGVHFDSHFSFTPHINHIVLSAKTIIYRIFKSFVTRNTDALLKAFLTYVRPLLEYCSPVWSPHLFCDIIAIESVQKLFTRKLLTPCKASYLDRLAVLKLDSLEKRRLIIDLTFCFKIMHGLVAGSLPDYGLKLCSNSLRGNSNKLYISNCRIDSRKFYFGNRISKVWNSLDDDVVNSPNPVIFKKKLNNLDLNQFLQFKTSPIL